MISGCTYPNAENYNPEATQNNGSCYFPQWYYEVRLVTLNNHPTMNVPVSLKVIKMIESPSGYFDWGTVYMNYVDSCENGHVWNLVNDSINGTTYDDYSYRIEVSYYDYGYNEHVSWVNIFSIKKDNDGQFPTTVNAVYNDVDINVELSWYKLP